MPPTPTTGTATATGKAPNAVRAWNRMNFALGVWMPTYSQAARKRARAALRRLR